MSFLLKVAVSAVLAQSIVAGQVGILPTQATTSNLEQFQNQPDFQQQQKPQQQQLQPLQHQQQLHQSPVLTKQDSHELFDATKMGVPGYTMQDPIQVSDQLPVQYAPSSINYNAEQDMVNGQASNDVPTYVDPYYAQYAEQVNYPLQQGYIPAGGYNQAPYIPPAFKSQPYNPGAFGIQTGYDGYLVPSPPSQVPQKEMTESSSIFDPVTNTIQAIQRNAPSVMRQATSALSQSLIILLGLLGSTVFGGGIITALCSFTPLCTISFAGVLPLLGIRSGIKSLAEPLVGAETAELLEKSIDKFKQMKNDEKLSKDTKSTPIATQTDASVDATVKSVAAIVNDVARTTDIVNSDDTDASAAEPVLNKFESSEKSDSKLSTKK